MIKGKIKDAPTFDDPRFVRPALLTIALYILVIVISSMTTVKLANASGSIPVTTGYAGLGCTSIDTTALAACVTAAENARGQAGACYPYIPGVMFCSWLGLQQPGYVHYLSCPDHATGTPTTDPTSCTCNNPTTSDSTNYVPDATGTSCVPAAACPVGKLTAPPFDDACSTSLEKGKGVDVDHTCGTLREPDMVNAASCIADKIHALYPLIHYTVPSATIRTTAYQNHLLEIWTKSQELNTIMNSVVYTPETKQACAPTYADVSNEKAQHGIDSPPSPSGRAAPHVEHRAIDVPRRVANALMDQVTTYTTTVTTVNGQNVSMQEVASDVEDYMHSAPNACDSNLSWGGRFDPEDDVHFQLP